MGKSWDTKKIHDFIETFENAAHNYMEGIGYLQSGYEKYQNNETFVGGGAEATKRFIGTKQSEFNRQQYELSKEMIKRYVDLDETFKAMVDPADDAKIDTDVVARTKTRFQRQLEEYESLAFAIQQKTMEDVDKFRKYCGDIEEVYVRDTLADYDEFCGTGGFLYDCIKKVEEFDDKACNRLFNSGIKDAIQGHIEEISGKAAGLDSIHSHAVDIDKHTLSLVALGTDATLNSINLAPRLMASNRISLVSPRYKTPRKWSLVKKKFSIDNIKSNAEINEVKYIESMEKLYGFSKEESKLFNDAYLKHCEHYKDAEKTGNREKADSFYTALACLFTQYSADSWQFKLMGNNKMSPSEAVAYFDAIGADGKALYDAVNNQHNTCKKNEKRDFAHECAIYSVMADDNIYKGAATLDDNVGELVGFKGDVYSGSMGGDDKMSDVSAYNIYYRMKKSEDGDIWNTMVEYNIDVCDGSINEATEFLQNMGYGNAKIGMTVLKTKLNYKTASALLITATSKTNLTKVKKTKEEFLDYIADESGIDWK
ncbi:hypothetical protein [Butyrivibrio sp. M55]|uniref:hypothetical protein n=1 Tax=Butyrivibrio sp. M55 TaxID=1855323 RepID=UPI0008EAC391|nr:hypothetical protein [Butyrivibrio sp. M55]SFU86828.1 hypothetical protein SAMN05216540_11561 [Butyrivibrio sp. M55]